MSPNTNVCSEAANKICFVISKPITLCRRMKREVELFPSKGGVSVATRAVLEQGQLKACLAFICLLIPVPSPWVRRSETGVGSQGQRREKCLLSAAVEWRQTTSHPHVRHCLWMLVLTPFFLVFFFFFCLFKMEHTVSVIFTVLLLLLAFDSTEG